MLLVLVSLLSGGFGYRFYLKRKVSNYTCLAAAVAVRSVYHPSVRLTSGAYPAQC